MDVQKYIPFQRVIPYDYTTIDGKAQGDIEEVLYTWQLSKSDKDDKFLLKRLSGPDVTLNDAQKQFTVNILNTDFSNIVDGDSYFEIFSIKYTGDSNFRDYVLKETNSDGEIIGDSKINILPSWVQLTS